ncbi:MAG: hypothetical protein WCN27_03480 [Alphaproteobacteria bacterium]
MGNTYRNRNISLTVLALAIALSTSLSAASDKYEEFALLGDATLEHKTFITPANTLKNFRLLDAKGNDYAMGSHTIGIKKGDGVAYTTNTSQVGTILKLATNTGYTYTPPSTITTESTFDLVYYWDNLGNRYWGNLTLMVYPKSGVSPNPINDNTEVQRLADRVQKLETESMRKEIMLLIENAVNKEERARMREMHQLELKQIQLATVLSILNSRIDELNATPCSWGGWFKSLWR